MNFGKEDLNKRVEKIKTENIKLFVKYAVDRLPDYFWTIPASTSGKYHGGESLLSHVLCCVDMGFFVCEQQKNWTQLKKDQLIAALLLHDGWRCGDGLDKYTKEDFENGRCIESSIDLPKTNKNHAKIAFYKLFDLKEELISTSQITTSSVMELVDILEGIYWHMGPWTEGDTFDFMLPYDSVIVQVHNIDYHQTKLSEILKNR